MQLSIKDGESVLIVKMQVAELEIRSMDVGHLPLLARLSGTLCPRTRVIRMFLRTVTGSHWRRFYFRSTSVFSAFEVILRECAI